MNSTLGPWTWGRRSARLPRVPESSSGPCGWQELRSLARPRRSPEGLRKCPRSHSIRGFRSRGGQLELRSSPRVLRRAARNFGAPEAFGAHPTARRESSLSTPPMAQLRDQALVGWSKYAPCAPTTSDTVDDDQAEHAITRRLPLLG